MKVTGPEGSFNQSKIDEFRNREKLPPAKSAGRAEAATSERGSAETVVVSNLAREIGKVKTNIKNTSDIRREKVEALKAKIESGEYEVSGEKIAGKIIEDIIKQSR